jgi:nitrogen regulatory protein PII
MDDANLYAFLTCRRITVVTMFAVRANISVGAMDEVRDSLLALGITRLRMAGVNGYTSGQHREIVYRGARHVLPLFPEVEVEAIARDEEVDQVVGTIIRVSRQMHGDGYVIVTPVDQCYRIRTGAREI